MVALHAPRLILIFVFWLSVNRIDGLSVPGDRPSPSRRPRASSSAQSSISRNTHSRSFYQRRKDGASTPVSSTVGRKRSKKPPRWEKEGDDLYREIVLPSNGREITHQEARTMLQNVTSTIMASLNSTRITPKQSTVANATAQLDTTNIDATAEKEPTFLWGGLSVGPVWKSRLVQAGFTRPTSVQRDAFRAITKSNDNVILASATGSGKTLAYLLPLLTTAIEQKLDGSIWIVTPTIELAFQVQGVVMQLNNREDEQLSQVLRMPLDNNEPTTAVSSPLVIATSKVFLNYLSREEDKLRLKNMHTIVLDEADKLLQTEAVARLQQLKKEQSTPKQSKKSRGKALKATDTELLLQKMFQQRRQYLCFKDSEVRVVCASATVGRTLRRQVMELVGASSMDNAATLVTDTVRTKKDDVARKVNLLPKTLVHKYFVLPGKQEQSEEADSGSLLLKKASDLIHNLPPAPMLIFPGRTGVKAVQSYLRESTENSNILGLEDIEFAASTRTVGSPSSWQDTLIYVVNEKLGRGLDIPGIRYVLLLQVPSSAAGYAHMAGRTGRNGVAGEAICICPTPQQAPKLCIIAETLGLSMEEVVV